MCPYHCGPTTYLNIEAFPRRSPPLCAPTTSLNIEEFPRRSHLTTSRQAPQSQLTFSGRGCGDTDPGESGLAGLGRLHGGGGADTES